MLTENGMNVDPDALEDVLRRADLITIGFSTFPERLLVDTRSRRDEGPLVAIVPPVTSVQDRYLWLGQHRGAFGAPEAFSFFLWPQTVRSLAERDVLAPLRQRLGEASESAAVVLDQALRELLDRERAAMIGAIRGESGWQTIWEFRPGP